MRNTKFAGIAMALMFAAVAAPLSAADKKEVGAIEGMILDQNRYPLEGLSIDLRRNGSELAPTGSTYRFLLKTNRRGRFLYAHFPIGTYSVTIAGRDGRVLKEITDVAVEAGKVRNLDVTIQVAQRPGPTPTQPDIVRGCVTVGDIRFRPARLLNLDSNVGITGSIANTCGREVQVKIETTFYDAGGNRISGAFLEKLVSGSFANFYSAAEPATMDAKHGRVVNVYVE
jgi:hypothetical protein